IKIELYENNIKFIIYGNLNLFNLLKSLGYSNFILFNTINNYNVDNMISINEIDKIGIYEVKVKTLNKLKKYNMIDIRNKTNINDIETNDLIKSIMLYNKICFTLDEID